MAAEDLGRIDPLVMIVDGLSPPLGVGIAERPLIIDHDQYVLDALAGGSAIQLGEVFLVVGLVLEELVDILAGADAILALCDSREVKIGHFVTKERPVQ